MKARQLNPFPDHKPEPPSQAHSPTSRAAAESIEPRSETLRRAALDCFRRHRQLAQGEIRYRGGGEQGEGDSD
jgi:hypothetical protein